MKIFKLLEYLSICFLFISCERFLDVKPDKSLAIPSTLQDLQALLDTDALMNVNYPDAGDIASDYYYMADADWAARTEEVREVYCWHPDAQRNQWLSNYSRINYSNIVLNAISDNKLMGVKEVDKGHIKGAAHFFRGFTFLHLINLYAPPYEMKNKDKLGIPLRLEADFNLVTKRASLEESFQQIINDFKNAVYHLPVSVTVPTRPSKPAAYAALARTYLIMGDYLQAQLYADSCLSLKSNLMDYNDLDLKMAMPFNRFNSENLFYAEIVGTSGVFLQSRAKVNVEIYDLYEDNDLRKQAFFIENKDGSHSFKGSYAGRAPTNAFAGLAIDEVLLIRSEAAIRLGKQDKALNDLNTLLENRYKKGEFQGLAITDNDALLGYILQERIKELVFRGGIYWSDLRRLNLESRFARDLVREVNGEVYRLSPYDLRYTFLIPEVVIQQTEIQQNLR